MPGEVPIVWAEKTNPVTVFHLGSHAVLRVREETSLSRMESQARPSSTWQKDAYILFVQAMHERCGNPKFPAYLNVRVCERWSGEHGFDHFLADCGLRKPGQTIGRCMDCGDYCAENARFMSQAEQQEEKKKKRRFIQNTLTNALRNGPYSKEKKRRKK